eukprot:5667550-Prymnesium_polylepis.2
MVSLPWLLAVRVWPTGRVASLHLPHPLWEAQTRLAPLTRMYPVRSRTLACTRDDLRSRFACSRVRVSAIYATYTCRGRRDTQAVLRPEAVHFRSSRTRAALPR